MKLDVKQLGIAPDTGELLTAKIQEIINNASAGDIIYFPQGSYKLSTIHLKSDLTIEIGEGATILGSDDFYDFERHEKIDYPIYQDASHTYFNTSLFLGLNCHNIKIIGSGKIDMQSVWDEDNIRDIVHRAAKVIALKECDDVLIEGITILNATDLAIYFAGCSNVHINNCKLRVYIDGVSPDNSKHVLIENCDILAGDDAIVFKTSYVLNRVDICNDIEVRNCRLSSRCNTIKFGTESIGGFTNIHIHDCDLSNVRMSGIAVESVDGAIIDNLSFRNIRMKNVNSPIFVMLGDRLRAPEGTKVGYIKNIVFENIVATGPYETYESIAWNYVSFKENDYIQDPHIFLRNPNAKDGGYNDVWQFTSNVFGLRDNYLENITFRNVEFEMSGGVKEYVREVPEEPSNPYPETYVHGKVLPASGLYCRYVKNLVLDNVKITTLRPDEREPIVTDGVI